MMLRNTEINVKYDQKPVIMRGEEYILRIVKMRLKLRDQDLKQSGIYIMGGKLLYINLMVTKNKFWNKYTLKKRGIQT